MDSHCLEVERGRPVTPTGSDEQVADRRMTTTVKLILAQPGSVLKVEMTILDRQSKGIAIDE
jgi:hypothetical protein